MRMMKKNAYFQIIDNLTVIHEVICLSLEGTFGKISRQQAEGLKMADRNLWRIYEHVARLAGVKSGRMVKRLSAGK